MSTSNPGTLIRNPKLRGEWAELRFMTRAAEHGLMVSKPWGDSAPYDVMVEHQGRIQRVQIKSTMRRVQGSYRCHLPVPKKCGMSECGAGAPARDKSPQTCHPEGAPFAPRDLTILRSHNSVSKTGRVPHFSRTLPQVGPNHQPSFDFLAAYLIPLDLWYIIPAQLVMHLSARLGIAPNHKGHKYEPYQEAWHLLM